MLIAYIPFIVCIIGLLLFLLAKNNPDVKDIGRVMFWTGLLVTLFTSAGHVVHLG